MCLCLCVKLNISPKTIINMIFLFAKKKRWCLTSLRKAFIHDSLHMSGTRSHYCCPIVHALQMHILNYLTPSHRLKLSVRKWIVLPARLSQCSLKQSSLFFFRLHRNGDVLRGRRIDHICKANHVGRRDALYCMTSPCCNVLYC